MKKTASYVVLLALVFAAIYWFMAPDVSDIDQTKEKLATAVQDGVLEQVSQAGQAGQPGNDDLSALAMKAIDLRQGEGGVQLWRLEAEWGNLRQEDGLLFLEKPRFSYRMDDGETVRVVSATGDIDQDGQIVRFVGEVEARHSDNLLRAPLMVYNGKDRTLTLPDPAEFTAPGLELKAARVVWALQDQTISGDGGVSARWEREEKIPGSDSANDNEAAPAVSDTPDAPAAPAISPTGDGADSPDTPDTPGDSTPDMPEGETRQ